MIKKKVDGLVEKYKVQLMQKGSRHIKASIIKRSSRPTVKSTFLIGDLEEEIYMHSV